jgi:hypothetical protein
MSKLIILSFVIVTILIPLHLKGNEAMAKTFEIDKVVLNADSLPNKKFLHYSNSASGILNVTFPAFFSLDTNFSNYDNIFGKDIVEFYPSNSSNSNNIALGVTNNSLTVSDKQNITNYLDQSAKNQNFSVISSNSNSHVKNESGHDISSLAYTFSYSDGAKGDGKVFATIKGDKIYYIDFSSDSNKDFTKYLPDVEQMVKSLNLVK